MFPSGQKILTHSCPPLTNNGQTLNSGKLYLTNNNNNNNNNNNDNYNEKYMNINSCDSVNGNKDMDKQGFQFLEIFIYIALKPN